MKAPLKLSEAISAIDKAGILLVFPINNRKEPKSLWTTFFPRSEMRWEWDDGGDGRVANLWHLREELSRSQKVVYAKWYQGRATFFSRKVFTAMLSRLLKSPLPPLSKDASRILRTLQENSPLSTKRLKAATDFQGKFMTPAYEKALKQLWQRLLIVGFGEVDDGAFPSLAIGATSLLFEDLWREANELDVRSAYETICEYFPEDEELFLKAFHRMCGKEVAAHRGIV